MSRLTDTLDALEDDLNKYRGDDVESLRCRRLVLRRTMQEWGREQYDEGYRDGGRDERYARSEAQRRADEHAAAGEG